VLGFSRYARKTKHKNTMQYIETFDNGPGGWYGWISNAAGPKPLEIRDSCAISRSPWRIEFDER
jgi:hypothetical protein